MRKGMSAVLVAGAIAYLGATLGADVKTNEKSQMKFEGMMGKVINFVARKATRMESTVALKGNRKSSMSGDNGEIIDLNEDKVYALDLKKKTYTVVTFDELRRHMEDARKKAEAERQKQASQPAKAEQPQPTAKNANQPQMEIEVDIKNTGQTKAINGFDTREVVMTISAHEKGKTLDQAGGLVMTSSMWMAPKIAALQELAEFDQRYARKLASAMLGTSGTSSAEDTAAMAAMYPMLQDVSVRMRTENAKMDGSAIQTTMTVEAVASAEMMAEQQKQDKDSGIKPTGGVGGLLGGLAGRMAKKKTEGSDSPQGRSTIMTMTHEVVSVATNVSAGDVAIPDGFRLKQ